MQFDHAVHKFDLKLSEALCSKRIGLNVHKFDLKLSEALCRLCSKRVGSNVHKFE